MSVSRWVDRLVAWAISLSGLVGLVVAVYAVLVLGLGHVPTSQQWTLLGFSTLAAVVAALLWAPARPRLSSFARRIVRHPETDPAELLRTYGSRMTRAIPLDELLLQLAESLRQALALDAAEIWTGSGGVLERTASDPDRGPATLILTPAEETVVSRAGVSGATWLAVWLPQLVTERPGALRVAPVTNAGELLGLITAERTRGGEPFSDEEEHVLADLARQVGLSLRNVRLDSALQASLDEVRHQAEELRASRARVVAAADAERRRIERDLHDGAQQHLVALSVNLRLARELAESNPAETRRLLERIAQEVRDAIEGLRELAHGIYPPLLLDSGLSEALTAAATRAGKRVRVEAPDLGRYPPGIEATVYFCCLEALQNFTKHAGVAARATIRVWEEQGGLLFEVADDGEGFASAQHSRGAGLTNMSDRVGALGGRLSFTSQPGTGTRVSGTIPLAP